MEVEIERTLVGRVMGPGGATINAIRSEVGCVLRFVKDEGTGGGKLFAAGSAQQLAAVQQRVGEALEAPAHPPPGVLRGASTWLPAAPARRRSRRDATPPPADWPSNSASPPPPPPASAAAGAAAGPAAAAVALAAAGPEPSQEYLLTVAPRDAQVLLGLPGLKEEARRAGVRLQTREDDDGWLHLTLRGSAGRDRRGEGEGRVGVEQPARDADDGAGGGRGAAVDPADGVAYTRDEFVAEHGGTREWEAAKRETAKATAPQPPPPSGPSAAVAASALRRGTATAATTAASLATRTRTSQSWCVAKVASTRS